MWKKQSSEKSYIIYFSPKVNRLLWLPSTCYPGIPANTMNIGDLYTTESSKKLQWFYSQVILFENDNQLSRLTTDKRIRIILNRKTVLHDSLLAFATLTKEDMAKQIRLQFNGEVSMDVRVSL